MLRVNANIQVPLTEFDFTFARSGGPGGQNVNKVNSKVTLRWNVKATDALPEGMRARFCKSYHRRITKDGELVIHSQRYRDQGRNVADCLDKLRDMLLEASIVPRKRRPTRRTRGSNERRLQEKRESSQKKQMRRKPKSDD